MVDKFKNILRGFQDSRVRGFEGSSDFASALIISLEP